MAAFAHRVLGLIWLGVLVLTMATGCSTWPHTYASGVDQLTVHQKVRSARAQRIENHPGLRVDSAANSHLQAALAATNLSAGQAHARHFLTQAHDLAVETARSEILRLDQQSIDRLAGQYFPQETTVTRVMLIDAYAQASDQTLAQWQQRIAAQASLDSLHAELRALARRVEKPVKYQGKTGRMLPWLLFYIPSKMAADHVQKQGPGCPLFLGGFDQANQYTPAYANDDSLLARHAPTIIVEQNPQANYLARVDRIGQVVALDADHVQVQTESPRVYAYMRELLIAGQPHKQLVYVAWFPEHPPMRTNDPMAGHIDGLTLRITLDAQDQPMLVETIANCGCFHGLYPVEKLEAAAVKEYGPPAEGMGYALEREQGQKLNAHIPGLLEPQGHVFSPVVYVAAGVHAIVHVSLEQPTSKAYRQQPYQMVPYADLELLAVPGGGYTSMFYDNGLVRNAQRPEGVYFTPIGMLSAGQPRQRETQLIYWDQYDFDEPSLLTRLLRLPTKD